MCGISGIAFLKDNNTEFLVKGMVRIQDKRGPDSSSLTMLNEDVFFGFNRLAIIDLEKGMQPFFSEDRTITAICNGEIYNFNELREDLRQRGHKFLSKNDCEVIPHAYEEWGIDLFNKLNGMFALAIFDQKAEKIILGRDHFGIKPLCYSFNPKTRALIFASELKAISWAMQQNNSSLSQDTQALISYFHLGYIPFAKTIFKEAHKLPPGHYLEYQRNKVPEIRCYWTIGLGTGAAFKGDEDDFLVALEDSVRRCLVSDVPIGVFLSGGLDSSLLTYYANKNKPGINTFSVGFSESEYDETKFASTVAKKLSLEPSFVQLTMQDCRSHINDIVSCWGEPFGDSSAMPVWLISRFARQKVKTILSGDGVDEILGGYETYQADKLCRILNFIPRSARHLFYRAFNKLTRVSYNDFAFSEKLRRFLAVFKDSDALGAHYSWRYYFNEDDLNCLLPDFSRQITDYRKEMVGLYMEPLLRRFGNDPVNMYMAFDTEFYLPNDMLFKVDSMSMANSLEVRVPYLDRRIVELALNIPSAKKISFRQTKIILRKACQDKFPPSITMRRKKGFTVPVGKWFLEDLGDELSGLAENSNCRPDFINTGFIKKLIKEHRGGIANHGYKLWILYIFFLWNKSSAVTPKQNDR